MKAHASAEFVVAAVMFMLLTSPVVRPAFISLPSRALPESVEAVTRATFPLDTLRALIVYVRFEDDSYEQPCQPRYVDWSSTQTTPPLSTSHILVPAEPDGSAPIPPYPDSSLTHYFYAQSSGSFVMYGETYPEVIVTAFPESHYNLSGRGVSRSARLGMGEITREALDYIDSKGFAFDQYDRNDDGYVDQIVMIVRRFANDTGNTLWTGYSILGDSTEPELEYDGRLVDWTLSGQFDRYDDAGILLPVALERIIAHETGHKIWPRTLSHLQPIRTNDVPYGPPDPVHEPPSRRNGYSLMPGDGGAFSMAGAETISAFERDLVGWIECPTLVSTTSDVSLADLFDSGDCRKIALDNGSAGNTIYLSNLQRQDYFDGFFRYQETCGFSSFDGLMTTGLLVGLSTGNTLDSRYDELPADNTLQRTAQDSAVYFGDLYGPLTSRQITPWTRPNINGWTVYPDQFSPSWEAVDNIRRSGNRMIFDYKADFRISPVIRDSSWMGAETAGESLTGVVTITSGSVLTLTDDIVLPDVHIESGGKLIVEPAANPRITGSLTFDNTGVLDVRPGGSLTGGE